MPSLPDPLQPSRSFVALVTCFDDREQIDYPALRRQVRRQIKAGNNLLLCGTNGEFTSLTMPEKLKICAEVLEEVNKRVLVFANAGMPSTYESVLVGREMAALGVDAVAIITPYFLDCTQEGLHRHFTTIADRLEKPVYLYNIPSRTHNGLLPETINRLAAHANIHGIKDSGGDAHSLECCLNIAKQHQKFDVYTGPSSLIYHGLRHGASGCISGLGNLVPQSLQAICHCFDRGDLPTAGKHQALLAQLRDDLYRLGYHPAMVKRALYLMDNSVGTSRQPALLPNPVLDETISGILEKFALV